MADLHCTNCDSTTSIRYFACEQCGTQCAECSVGLHRPKKMQSHLIKENNSDIQKVFINFDEERENWVGRGFCDYCLTTKKDANSIDLGLLHCSTCAHHLCLSCDQTFHSENDHIRQTISEIHKFITLSITVADYNLQIKFNENLSSYAGVNWDRFSILPSYLNQNRHLFRNKNVLELGCGCAALPSLTCWILGSNVVCSDMNCEALELLNENIMSVREQLMKQEAVIIGSIVCKELRFGDLLNEKFDIILGSYILYHSHAFEDLVFTIKNLLNESGEIIFISHEPTREVEFIEKCKSSQLNAEKIGIQKFDQNYSERISNVQRTIGLLKITHKR